MTALIDGDILMYRICFTLDVLAPLESIKNFVDEYITNLLTKTGCHDYIGILGIHGSNNTKYLIYPDYKRGRPVDKPPHWNTVMNILISRWRFVTISGCETDDALALCSRHDTTMIVSSDKDLLQIPGWHYRLGITRKGITIKEDEKTFVSIPYAKKYYYLQMLTGDTVDNVKGCRGIGPKTANTILDNCKKEGEMFWAVARQYKKAFGEAWIHTIKTNKALLQVTGFNAAKVGFERPTPVFFRNDDSY